MGDTYASKTERNEGGVGSANDSCEEVVADAETNQQSKQEYQACNYVDADEGDLRPASAPKTENWQLQRDMVDRKTPNTSFI
jgi:hypothetical protein